MLQLIVFMIIMMILQTMQLTDFRLVWTVAFLVNLGAFIVCWAKWPETRARDESNKNVDQGQSLIEQVKGEFREYGEMFAIIGVPAVMVSYVFKASSDALFSLMQPLPMAYYSMNTEVALLYME